MLGTTVAAVAAVAAGAVGLWLGQTSSLPPDAVASPTASASADANAGPTTPVPGPLAGVTIALDPGHNAGNADAPGIINDLVSDGRGGLKSCNTVGTATVDGYREYEFTWDVADRTRVLLEERGATVLLTRGPDGVGPCVDVRGQFANDATALVSIHGNGSESAAAAGYFAILVANPQNEAQGTASAELAGVLLAELAAEGFAASNVVEGAIQYRDDLGTLNFAQRPAVLLELAEFRNPVEGAAVQDPAVRERYARAIADGITARFGAPG